MLIRPSVLPNRELHICFRLIIQSFQRHLPPYKQSDMCEQYNKCKYPRGKRGGVVLYQPEKIYDIP